VARQLLAVALVAGWVVAGCPAARAQSKAGDLKPPEPGYSFPPGGPAGTTLDVLLGGYDWTPDLQFFAFTPGVRISPTAPPGPVLVPPPPYWFGPKGTQTPPPLPREQPARVTLPAGLPSGPVRWAVAGASGAGAKTGIFWVGNGPEVVELPPADGPQKLPALPVTVNGRLSKLEEVDRYRFTAPADGPVTCEVFARRLGVNVNAALTVCDARGTAVADAVDTGGTDLAVTFRAARGAEYTVSLHDLDFRGDPSFVYRLAVTPGPRVVATVTAAGRRGAARDVEFVGYGVRTGGAALESVTRRVAFPADPAAAALAYALDTPWGAAPPFDIPLTDFPETVATPGDTLTLPAAVTGVLDGGTAGARFRCSGVKGDVWELAAEARRFASPLDVALAVLGPDGKELARNDDLPGTTDAGLTFTLPADGTYTLAVSDLSGRAGTRAAVYRLAAARPTPDFTLSVPARLNLPLGATADLVVTAARRGGHAEPITVTVAGLPDGVSVPGGLVIPAGKAELKIPVRAAADGPAVAGLITVTGTADGLTRVASAPAPGDLTARHAASERVPAVLLATTLAPRLKLAAVEADGGRKVHRGSTHPAEVTLERFAGFDGPVSLQMAATQGYQRQGIIGPDLDVPAGAGRAFYPCFMPEWLETTRTSRMALVGVVRVPDPRGKARYLVTPMAGQVTMSIEGALLKVDVPDAEVRVRLGETVTVPVTVLRSPKLAEPVRLELVVPEALAGRLTADAVTTPAGAAAAELRITRSKGGWPAGRHTAVVRGVALRDGLYRVVSEASITVVGTGE
jgi:hypothetical protein